jgi:hypothetical protein
MDNISNNLVMIDISSLPKTPEEEKLFKEAKEYLESEFEIPISTIFKIMINGVSGFVIDNDYEYVENFVRNYLDLPKEEQKKIFVNSDGEQVFVWDDVQTGAEEDHLSFLARLFIREIKEKNSLLLIDYSIRCKETSLVTLSQESVHPDHIVVYLDKEE